MSLDELPEEWRPVPDWPGYQVSDLGRVRSFQGRGFHKRGTFLETPKLLSPFIHKDTGYPGYNLSGGPKRSLSLYAHRLVLAAFVGPCPPGMECRHLDGNRTNNRLDNLAWGTRVENSQDRAKHWKNGVAPRPYLDPSEVREARRLISSGSSRKEAAKALGVSYWTIRAICIGRTYSHVI